jgi:hypothetical protein
VRLLVIALAVLPACGNTYHPEYHPETSVNYSQTIASPVSVHTSGAQPIVVHPSPPQPVAPLAPPAVRPLAPPPPEMAPPEMEW